MVGHPTLLRGAGGLGATQGPLIIQRTEDEFVAALLDELADQGGLATVASTRPVPKPDSGTLVLFQPVHRVFHLALLEVVCDRPGYPRLDPAKIEGAGLVMRRCAVDSRGSRMTDALEAWVQEAPTARSRAAGAERRRVRQGWVRFAGRVGAPRTDLDRDPDPRYRRPELQSGHPEIDRRLALGVGAAAALAESVLPLFVAPPEVCAASGRTLLYGLIPTTAAEQGEAAEEIPPYDIADLQPHLPQFLRPGLAPALPTPGDFVSVGAAAAATGSSDLRLFVQQLRQLAVELDALGDGAESRTLREALNAEQQLLFLDNSRWPAGTTATALAQLAMAARLVGRARAEQGFPGLVRRGAGDFLVEAARVLVLADDPNGSVRMPLRWPALSAAQGDRIMAACAAAMTARIKAVVPRGSRFGDANRAYRVRGFVRVRGEQSCPPALVWSEYSEPFTIAPWFAASGRPPTTIPLPGLDRDALKALKPNLAFAVPQKLADFLNGNDPKAMVKGEGDEGGQGIALDWICSFNLPVITLCAFIVLNLFLSLFDLIFRWMLFIKICIPIPRRK